MRLINCKIRIFLRSRVGIITPWMVMNLFNFEMDVGFVLGILKKWCFFRIRYGTGIFGNYKGSGTDITE